MFNETQYTASAFRWGENAAVKYRLRPIQDATEVLSDAYRTRYDEIIQERGSRCLEEALALVVGQATRALDFNLEIQFADLDILQPRLPRRRRANRLEEPGIAWPSSRYLLKTHGWGVAGL